jgi:ATP/maltotriose-dependent transcriptional regulator MalT
LPIDEEVRAVAAECTALQRPDWPPRVRYCGLLALGFVALRDGRDTEADALLERSLECARACGSEILVRRSLGNIADRALIAGDVEKAVRMGRELMSTTPERHYHAWVVRSNLATALMRAGEIDEARGVLASWMSLSRSTNWDAFGVAAPIFALLPASEGRYEAAAKLLGHALHCIAATGNTPEANEQAAFDAAKALVEKHLDAATRERMMAEGATLDQEGACALTLEAPPVKAPAARPTPPSRRKLSA